MDEKELLALLDKLISSKLDAVTTRLDKLEAPPEQKEDKEDPRLSKASEVMKSALKENLSKEKLDALSFDELVIAMALKEDFKPEVGIIPPTGGQVKKEDNIDVPEQFRAHYPEGGLI